jgi:hypothetical protein
MTIGAVFEYASEPVEVRVDGANILFRTMQSGGWLTIDNIKLDYAGVVREFPDLEGSIIWKEEAIKRFKEKIKELKTEKLRIQYIINDLKKHGYIPRFMQQKGFRPEAIK